MHGARQIGPWVLCIALATGARPARADDPPLVWEVPDGCGSPSAFVERVGVLLGRAPARALPGGRTFVVRVATEEARHRLAVSEEGTDEPPRELMAQDCASLVEAAAIVVALRIDPEAVARVQRAPDEDAASPILPADSVDALGRPPASVTPAADVSQHAGPRWILGATLGGSAGLLLLPAPSPGIAAALFAERGAWRVELGGSWWAPQQGATQEHPEAGAEVELLTAVLRGCHSPWRRAVQLDGCLALEVGSMAGHGTGVVEPRAQVATWLAGEAGARGRIPLGEAIFPHVRALAYGGSYYLAYVDDPSPRYGGDNRMVIDRVDCAVRALDE